MRGNYRLILINGAIGVGKTWVAEQLAKERNGLRQVSLNDGLKHVMSGITGLDLMNPVVYAEFKNTIFENGMRGRDWQIEVSESSKKYDTLVWVKRFMDRIRERTPERLIICDSFGFPVEFQGICAVEDVDTLNVYIDDGDGHTYAGVAEGDYRQFANDSRFDLSRHCSIRAVNSTQALAAIKQSLLNRGW